MMRTAASSSLSPVLSKPWVLRDYAFLADGERGAVIGPHGEVVWLCAPRWDSDAVFSALIGGGGEYLVSPEDDWHVWGGSYEDGTLIRASRWVTASGIVECREALAMPATPDRLVLLRRVRAVRGDAHVEFLLDPRPGFGRQAMGDLRREGELWCASGAGLRLRFAGAAHAGPAPGGGLRGHLTVPDGTARDLVLEIRTDRAGTSQDRGEPDPDVLDPDVLWRRTEQAWRRAVPDCHDLPASRDARHAYAVLTGLTSSSGGMAAAATTSLPERADVGRNYDYRYTWLRDQAYAGIAVAAHGAHPLLDNAVRFVTARVLEDGEALRPIYTVGGGRVPEPSVLPLPGYPSGGDRVGNQAAEQFQLDTFAETLQLYAAAARHDRLDGEARRAVDVVVRAVERHWQQPDAGLWELEKRWWTHSRLSAVAGLRALAAQLPQDPAAERWRELAEAVLRETRRRCLRPDGAWARAEDDEKPDAALLIPFARGLLTFDDTFARTRRLVESELAVDGFVYRFQHDNRPLGQDEGAFLLCGFVMAMATHQEGDHLAAHRWFERGRSAYGPAGLFSEEYDVQQRQLRGNLPQAFVHAALLESAVRLGSGGARPALGG
ncbi:glycoside hydrolase family 15 protein [Streptomyces sp. 891-h]|uniref:glycoside hydrolase family 15 protein n=1 Tax=Streptomyces sp. 891-h TaxID=2720714 RepID=UPI001FA9F21C|nr:glycoside hydrolase family 15 protein [Streptomyces sp. 891-h]UNZ20886.1 glycoside hydrolase family 15 protein [Streptomyces sp. 891-h]